MAKAARGGRPQARLRDGGPQGRRGATRAATGATGFAGLGRF